MINPDTFTTVTGYNVLFGFGICTLGGILGGLFPDIDHPQSIIGRKKKITSHIVNYMTGHRGLIHYPIFLLWVSFMCFIGYYALPLTFIFREVYFLFVSGFISGYASHIFIDLFNKKGIKLLAPFCRINFCIPVGLRLVNYKGHKKIRFKYLSGSSPDDQITCIFFVVFIIILLFYFV